MELFKESDFESVGWLIPGEMAANIANRVFKERMKVGYCLLDTAKDPFGITCGYTKCETHKIYYITEDLRKDGNEEEKRDAIKKALTDLSKVQNELAKLLTVNKGGE